MLICSNCGAVNQDMGGDPRNYICGNCHNATLFRPLQQIPLPAANNNDALTGAVLCGTLGGLIAGGPVGVIVGIVIGAVLGDQYRRGHK